MTWPDAAVLIVLILSFSAVMGLFLWTVLK
jgi:hypothetical protein